MTASVVPPLESPRLLLRKLALEDGPQMQAIFPQWEILKHMNASIPWPYPDDGVEIYLRERALPAMEMGTDWHWSIRPKSAPDMLIGVISLHSLEDNNRGFWLDPKWQRQGLMSEAAAAVMRFWFENLGKPVLRVPKAVDNIASRRISEKEGMRVVATGEKDFVGGRFPVEIWEITAEKWLAKSRSEPSA